MSKLLVSKRETSTFQVLLSVFFTSQVTQSLITARNRFIL